MSRDWQARLESAVSSRLPRLSEYLNPGIAEERIRAVLARNRVVGATEAIVDVFTWRDGTRLAPELVSDPETPLIRGTGFHFMDLELAIAHFDHGRVVGKKNPRLAEGAGRYFPLFWNGHTSWLATDVDVSHRNRMMIVDHDGPVPFREGYESFGTFIEEAILAIEQRREMRLFR